MKQHTTPTTLLPTDFSEEPCTSEQMYRREITQYTRLPAEQEDAIADLARQGNAQARHDFITLLLRNVEQFASRYSAAYFWESARIEYQELVAVGNLALVEKLDRALATDHPVPYLLTIAYGAIRAFCRRYKSLIRTPDHDEAPPPMTMVSMDVPFTEDDSRILADTLAAPAPLISSESPQDYTALHQAIEGLPPKQHIVILRHYGLHDTAPQALCVIERDLYGTNDSNNADDHKKRGLNTLRYRLALTYPQYATSKMSKQEQRLAEAYAALQASGQPVTVERLRALTKADTTLTSLYLTQREGSRSQRSQQRAYQRLSQAYAHLQTTGQRISLRQLIKYGGVDSDTARAFMQQQGIPLAAATASPEHQQERKRRLDLTYAALQASGQRISARSLAKEARTDSRAASAYLKQMDAATAADVAPCYGGDAA